MSKAKNQPRSAGSGHRQERQPPVREPALVRDRRSSWYALLLLAAAALLAYCNSFSVPLLFDDLNFINNLRIRQLWPPWAPLGNTSRPLVQFSLAVNYAISGLNVWSYHVFNLAVHVLAAWALFGVVRRTLRTPAFEARYRPAATGLAAGAALLWMLHPLQTESVTYIIQRAEAMMGVFYLLSVYCLIRGAGPAHALRWQLCAVVACALGTACKPIMATAPVVLLLYDRTFLSASFPQALRRRGWMYLGLAATWILLAALLKSAPSIEWETTAGFGYGKISSTDYAGTQPGVIMHYLKLAFWPHPLCLDYAWPVARTPGAILPYAAIVSILLCATAWAAWRGHWLGFVGAWFFVILAPTSSFIPIADLAFEHRMYLPLASLAVLAVMGLHEGLRALSARSGIGAARPGLAGAVVLAVAATALGAATFERNRVYQSEFAMWSDVVAQRPENGRARHNLGLAMARQGRLDEAMKEFRESIRLLPAFADVRYSLGLALSMRGRTGEAIEQFTEAVRLKPNYPEAHYDLGYNLYAAGKTSEAVSHYREAIRLKPDYALAHNQLGVALRSQGNVSEAIDHYNEALRLAPDFPEARKNLERARSGQ